MYLLESPRSGDSNKYTKRMIYKKKCSKVSVTDALDRSISSFFITANSVLRQKTLVTNSVIIRRVRCRWFDDMRFFVLFLQNFSQITKRVKWKKCVQKRLFFLVLFS